MASTTHHHQDHMVAGSVAPAARWSADDGGSRIRRNALIGAAPVTATTNAVKPFHGYARRPSEGSS
jgi:hypothetical protein